MKKDQVESIRQDLILVDEQYREWNIKYFNGHLNRYLSDLQIVKKNYKGGKILEIGSLPYHLTAMLSLSSFDVTGLDVNPVRGNAFAEKYGLKIVKCDIETEALPFRDEQFDLVVFNEVFEHLRINPIRTLREINRVLAPGGKLILSTPNVYAIGNLYLFLRGRSIDNSPYREFLKLETLGHMGHVRIYSAREVEEFLVNTSFSVKEVMYRYNRKSKKRLLFKLFYRLIPVFRPQFVIISEKTPQS